MGTSRGTFGCQLAVAVDTKIPPTDCNGYFDLLGASWVPLWCGLGAYWVPPGSHNSDLRSQIASLRSHNSDLESQISDRRSEISDLVLNGLLAVLAFGSDAERRNENATHDCNSNPVKLFLFYSFSASATSFITTE